MKNLKKVLALVLAMAMVLSSFTVAFAAEAQNADEAATLYDLGLFNGESADEFVPNLEGETNREQAMVMLAQIFDWDVDADAESTFPDVSAWAVPYVEYAKDNGVTVGVGGGVFGAQDGVTLRQLLSWITSETGYGNAWIDVNVAVEAGLITEAQATDINLAALNGTEADLIRDDLVGTFYDALTIVNKNTGNTVIEDLVAAGAVSAAKAEAAGLYEEEPDSLEVKSVEATNLKQITVEFNSEAYDSDEVEDVDNYEFEGIALGDDEADEIAILDASVEGKVLTLTLETSVENQSEGTLVIDKAITGTELEFEEIEFFDTVIPKVVAIDVVGNDTVKVTFSEPMNFGVASGDYVTDPDIEDAFVLEDGDFFVKSVKVLKQGTEANVEFYTTFETEEYTFEVSNDIEDFAGFNVVPVSEEISVVEDEDAPEIVGYKDVTSRKATLIFSEDIEEANGLGAFTQSEIEDNFYHTNSSNPAEDYKIDGDELTIYFDEDYKLPNGTAYIYVEDEAIRDLWDNENEQRLYVEVKVDIDNEAPVVKEIEADSQNELVLTFDEELDSDSAEETDNYTVLDDGDEVDVRSAVYDDSDLDEIKVTLTLDDDVYGEVTVVVEDVEDLDGNAIEKQTIVIDVEDETAPEFANTEVTLYDVDMDIYTIIVDFDDDEMATSGKYSVLDLEKYVLEFADGTKINLDDIDSKDINIKGIDGNERVRIEIEKDASDLNSYVVVPFDGSNTTTATKVEIARVADAAGNYTSMLTSGMIFVEEAATVGVDGVEATDNDTIELTLEDLVDDFKATDFTITTTDGSVTLEFAGARVKHDGDESIVVFTLKDAYNLDDDATYNGLEVMISSTGANTSNKYGEPVAFSGEVIDDSIAPELVDDYTAFNGKKEDYVYADYYEVHLVFTEDINESTVSKYSFKVEDISVVDVRVQGNVVILETNTSDSDIPEPGTKVTQQLAIYDMSGNTVEDISTEVLFTN